MSLFSRIKLSIQQPTQVYEAKNMPLGQSILYFLFLFFILLIPITKETWSIVSSLENDFQKIAKELPDFSIEDNQLVTTEKESSFIYTSKEFVFMFDPEDIKTASDFQKDLIGSEIGVGILQDGMIFAVADDSSLATVLDASLIEFPYSESTVSQFRQTVFSVLAISTSEKFLMVSLAVLLTGIPLLISFSFSLFIGTFFAHSFSGARALGLKMKNSFKIMLNVSTLPMLVCAGIALFKPDFQITSIVLIGSMFLYFQVLKQQIDPNKTV